MLPNQPELQEGTDPADPLSGLKLPEGVTLDSDGKRRFGFEGKYDVVLAIRRIHTGQFHGLYELVRLDLDGDSVVGVHVITDGNDKATMLNMMRNNAVQI